MYSFEGVKEKFSFKKDINILETSLSQEVISSLHEANIIYVSQLERRTEEEILAIKSIDKDQFNEIKMYLYKLGKTFTKQIIEDDDIEW
jgi:DNA-directed RNA polymerase alpha subunit